MYIVWQFDPLGKTQLDSVVLVLMLANASIPGLVLVEHEDGVIDQIPSSLLC